MATVAENMRVVPEFDPSEASQVVEIVSARLDRRFGRFDDDQLELEISVKERDTPSQRVVLECWLAVSGNSRFVGTSTEASLLAAVRESADDVYRQVDRFLTRREDSRRG
ncbi:MAG: HPF/RaiA family ribosome-associated protein [Actinomycetes bacterium]